MEWIGNVPERWETRRLKTMLQELDDRKGETDLPLLSLTRTRGIILQSELHDRPPSAESFSSYRVCPAGSIVMNRMQAWSGMFGVSPIDGVVSPDYTVFRPRIRVNPRFIEYQLKAPFLVTQFLRLSKGIGSGFNRLYGDDFGAVASVLPPVDEQGAIVRFLDHMDSRIQRFINAKERLIALMDEEMQVVIDRAVTRGLDPGALLRPSGIEWLGDVPANWLVGPLRRFCKVVDCKHLTVPAAEGGLPIASVRETGSFDLDLATARLVSEASFRSLLAGGRKPEVGDLIYCRNVNVGASAYVGTSEPFALGQDVCLIRPGREVGRFLNYVMHSGMMKRQLALKLIGSTFRRINVSEVKSLVVAIPPRAEQKAIAASLDIEFQAVKRGIAAARSEAALLQEYRTRLISDVVTGKLDVRAAAAALPDDPQADDPALEEQLEEVAGA